MWGSAMQKTLGISTDVFGEAAAETGLVGKVARGSRICIC